MRRQVLKASFQILMWNSVWNGQRQVRYESANTFSPYKHFLFSLLYSAFYKPSTESHEKQKMARPSFLRALKNVQ